GLKALERFVGRCGISSKSLHLEDGCGLSRRNAVNARSVVGLLRAMHHHPVAEVFRSTLSVSGIDGTLSYRLSTKNTARRVRAKTGSMTYVSGLAGYAETASGDTVAFAVLCNNFSCSLSRVRWAEDSIIERFLETYP
ncbi:D-alanyl-D-alanine carboxypeptidase, partial [bacterium]|nr:D-alanyl-D-alanine carboxypeptidase [bacterium]